MILVSHRRKQVTVVRRDGQRWTQTELRAGETLQLQDGVSIAIDALYSVVDTLA